MTAGVQERADALRARRVPFVHARVVLAERPTSAKPGDEALVTPDGAIDGFVGGSCAQETVSAQAVGLLASGESMLLRIAPVPEADQPGKTVVHNPCLSGGTLEIFLEPVLPAPLVAILGESPIAAALREQAALLGYATAPADVFDLAGVDAVVVASHGFGEEELLTAAVLAGVPYVALVASPRRGAAVLAGLDLTQEQREGVATPAGLDIGARTPAEIALSVYAQMLDRRPRGPRRPRAGMAASAPVSAVDPVCGMSVRVHDDALVSTVGGQPVYFCGPGCLRAYEADPAAYPSTAPAP